MWGRQGEGRTLRSGRYTRLITATGATLAGSVALGWASPPALAALPPYHSPGYKGTKAIPPVAPVAPAPPLTLWTDSKLPDVLVDDAGSAHLTWVDDGHGSVPDALHFCRV